MLILFFPECDCYEPGSNNYTICDKITGQCSCKDMFTGRRCRVCNDGYYALHDGLYDAYQVKIICVGKLASSKQDVSHLIDARSKREG